MGRKEEYPQELIGEEDYNSIANLFPGVPKLRKRVALEISKYFNDKKILILEIGSGRGETTEFILKRVKNSVVISIDKSKEMVNDMKKKLRLYVDQNKLQIICAGAFDYINILENESIDCFTSSWTMHNFEKEKREILLKSIYRVLKREGLFINMDKYYHDNSELERKDFNLAIENYKQLGKAGKVDLMKSIMKHEEEDREENRIMREKESINLMESIGFKKPKVLDRVDRDIVLTATK